jgi:hypothetical protein
MREISIRRVRIVVSGRTIARNAGRELGASFASALAAKLAAALGAHSGSAPVSIGSISVRVPADGTPGTMAQAVTQAVGARIHERPRGENR